MSFLVLVSVSPEPRTGPGAEQALIRAEGEEKGEEELEARREDGRRGEEKEEGRPGGKRKGRKSFRFRCICLSQRMD